MVCDGPWAEVPGRFLSWRDTAQKEVWRFFILIKRLVLPVAALFALSIELLDPGLFSCRGALLLESLPLWAITFVNLRWISSQFLLADEGWVFLLLAELMRVRLHKHAPWITAVVVSHNAVFSLLAMDSVYNVLGTVLSLPFLVVLGVSLV